jgi:hypothetical protein
MRTRMDASEPDDSEPEVLDAWVAAGFDPRDAQTWRSWRFTIARAEAWLQQGVKEGLEAAQWMAAGVNPTTIQKWVDADIDASEAALWHEMGFDIDGAKAGKAKGLGPTDAFAQSQPTIRTTFPSVRRNIARGGIAGFGPSGDPRVMHGYHQREWLDEEAMKWASQGIEAADAYTWHALGLDPVEAGRLAIQGRGPGDVIREWWSAGFPFDEVADWIGAGLTSTEALEQRSQGITAEQAAVLRALRRQEQSAKPDRSVLGPLITPQGPPGSALPGPPPEDEAAAHAAVEDAFTRMLSVDETDFLNDHEARVIYSLTIGGPFSHMPMLKGRQGRAVLVDGQWKVARDTFAALMRLAGLDLPPQE